MICSSVIPCLSTGLDKNDKVRDGPLFFPRGKEGIAIGKKIVCVRKIAEINCLSHRCIRKKLSAQSG